MVRPAILRVALWMLPVGGGLLAQGLTGPIGSLVAEQSRSTFNVQGAGARALGLGGAFIAVADDATAVSFNPAGLSQLIRPEISLVGRWHNREVAYQDVSYRLGTRTLEVSDSSIGRTHFDPLLVAASVPLRVAGRTLSIQLCAQRIIPLAGGDSRDMHVAAEDGTGAPYELHQRLDQSGQFDVYSLALSYAFSQRIMLGMSLNQWRGVWGLNASNTKESGTSRAALRFTQNSRLEGTNLRLGLLWRWPSVTFGLVHYTGFHATQDTWMTLSTKNQGGSRTTTNHVDAGLHWPSATGLGVAYRPVDGWLVAADYRKTRWSQAVYMGGGPSVDGVGFFDLSRRRLTPDTNSMHLGLEYLLVTEAGRVVPLRIGVSQEQQPLVDRVTGTQRIMRSGSVGTGLRIGDHMVDLAFRWSGGHRHASQALDVTEILNQKTPRSTGREQVIEKRVDISYTVQFDRVAVERVLRHLFIGE